MIFLSEILILNHLTNFLFLVILKMMKNISLENLLFNYELSFNYSKIFLRIHHLNLIFYYHQQIYEFILDFLNILFLFHLKDVFLKLLFFVLNGIKLLIYFWRFNSMQNILFFQVLNFYPLFLEYYQIFYSNLRNYIFHSKFFNLLHYKKLFL